MPPLAATTKALVRQVLPDSLVRRVHRLRVARQLTNYEPWARIGSYGGHELTIRIADPLGQGWYGHDWGEQPELAMLRKLGALSTGARVFDLGAHQGVVALMLAREVGPDGHVLAVEAEAHNARVAYHNARANRAANLTILHAAVSHEDGTAFFSESLNGSIGKPGRGDVEVPSWTVDTLSATHWSPDLVFMDIEGYEGRALTAALNTIASGATFFVEVHVETLVDATPEHVVGMFGGRDLYIGENPTAESCDFVLYHGGPLPSERFYLIAAYDGQSADA